MQEAQLLVAPASTTDGGARVPVFPRGRAVPRMEATGVYGYHLVSQPDLIQVIVRFSARSPCEYAI
jgi:hypothetical protein